MNERATTVEISSFILCFLGGAAVVIIAVATFYSAVVKQSGASGAYALVAEETVDNQSTASQHVIVPPVLGDATLGSQNVCGCPGCCAVANS